MWLLIHYGAEGLLHQGVALKERTLNAIVYVNKLRTFPGMVQKELSAAPRAEMGQARAHK